MLRLWITLCFTLPGAMSFTIHNIKEGLCLEDSSEGEVHLKTCRLDSDLQQWMWTDDWFLVNTGSSRCLSAVNPVQTVACNSGHHIKWHCKAQQILSMKTSLALSSEGGKPSLDAGQHKWTSLDAGDICKDKLRSRRQRDADFESDFEPDHRMTEEHLKFLQWYYRTEDPTSWTFAMLGFAFLGLLIGCMLMVMGMMGNRSRKQIAKYRASIKLTAVKPEMEEMQDISEKISEEKEKKNSSTPLMQNSHTDWEEPSSESKATEELKPGEIVVTWKDGNVSTLYPEPAADEELTEETCKDEVQS